MRFVNKFGCKPIEDTVVKPCPFCGGIPFMHKSDRYPNGGDRVDGYTVICIETACVIYDADGQYYRTPEKALKRWNERVTQN